MATPHWLATFEGLVLVSPGFQLIDKVPKRALYLWELLPQKKQPLKCPTRPLKTSSSPRGWNRARLLGTTAALFRSKCTRPPSCAAASSAAAHAPSSSASSAGPASAPASAGAASAPAPGATPRSAATCAPPAPALPRHPPHRRPAPRGLVLRVPRLAPQPRRRGRRRRRPGRDGEAPAAPQARRDRGECLSVDWLSVEGWRSAPRPR